MTISYLSNFTNNFTLHSFSNKKFDPFILNTNNHLKRFDATCSLNFFNSGIYLVKAM